MMYKTFSGRVNRLSYLIAAVTLFCVVTLIDKYKNGLPTLLSITLSFLEIFMSFIVISIEARRFHDINKSGWWILTLFIPFFNLYSAIILFFQPGTFGVNRFGSVPQKGIHI